MQVYTRFERTKEWRKKKAMFCILWKFVLKFKRPSRGSAIILISKTNRYCVLLVQSGIRGRKGKLLPFSLWNQPLKRNKFTSSAIIYIVISTGKLKKNLSNYWRYKSMSLFAVPPRQLKLQFVEVCNCSHPLSQIERIFQNMTRQNLFDILVFVKKTKTKQNQKKKNTTNSLF